MNARRILLAGAAVLALLATPSPARAQLTDGDFFDGIDMLIQALFEMLLTPQPDLPDIFVADPLPPPILGDHVAGVPVTTEAALDLAEERLLDRTARVEVLNEIGELAADAATLNSAALEALALLNLTDPISVAARETLNTAADIAGAVASAVESQVEAAQTGLDADRAQQEAREQIEHWQQVLATNPVGQWQGVMAFETETIDLAY